MLVGVDLICMWRLRVITHEAVADGADLFAGDGGHGYVF